MPESRFTRRRSPGCIRADEALTLREFLRRADIGDHTWRRLRRKLRVRKVGTKRYILGSDWIALLESLPPEVAGPPCASGTDASSPDR